MRPVTANGDTLPQQMQMAERERQTHDPVDLLLREERFNQHVVHDSLNANVSIKCSDAPRYVEYYTGKQGGNKVEM